MVRRIYVEKKEALRHEAASLLNELKGLLGISGLTGLRLVNRYDVEGLDEATFDRAVKTVFSEPQVDDTYATLPETTPENITIIHAGSKLADGALVTNGGRVLGVVATAPTLKEALADAYAATETIAFEGKYMRHDIGQRALAAMEVQ